VLTDVPAFNKMADYQIMAKKSTKRQRKTKNPDWFQWSIEAPG